MKAYIICSKTNGNYKKRIENLGIEVTEDTDQCTDVFVIGNVEIPDHIKGKKLHYMDENVLPINYKEKANVLLGEENKC